MPTIWVPPFVAQQWCHVYFADCENKPDPNIGHFVRSECRNKVLAPTIVQEIDKSAINASVDLWAGQIMKSEPEYLGVSIVLVGDFNPAIFQPAWFAANGLLAQTEADNAEIQVIHPDISVFFTDWVRIRVEKKKFTAEINEQPYIRLHDLVVNIFGEFLPQTPVNQVGINFTAHVHISSAEEMDNIGRALAPIEPWGETGKLMDRFPAGDKNHGGLKSLKMQIPREDADVGGAIFATVEPSSRIKQGIFVQVNDHYELPEDPNRLGSAEILKIVRQVFEPSMNYSENILDHIVALGAES